MKGLVSLVGSGPGNPGLLTLLAKKRIEEADIIIYDYLANPAHLVWAKKSAQKFAIEKGFRHKKLSQDRINRLIVQSARRGLRVVRLKGGDPYLFGRGGEEALVLHEQGIPFEVVPGVTSATACGAYAGVPLTHRDHNASVTFLTGHRAHDKGLDSIPWDKLVSLGGTLVIYMGIYNLDRIAQGLLRAGMDANTPVCVTRWGTLPSQESCQGSLATIAALVKKKKLGAPAIILIGAVVGLRKKLNWYERLPFFGKTVLVTRPVEKAARLAGKIADLGGAVQFFSSIQIRPPKSFKSLDQALGRLERYQWVIFTSTYGVEAFFDRLKKRFHRDARALYGVGVAAVGPDTALALKRYGIEPDLKPKRYESRAIGEAFQEAYGRLDGARILLPRTQIAPEDLEKDLRRLGASFERVTAYETHHSGSMPASVKKALLSGRIHWVTFTSASSVESFARCLGSRDLKKILKKTRLASIGPVTSRALRRFGLKASCQAKTFTIEGLVESMKNAVS